jgi:hypothetical protein
MIMDKNKMKRFSLWIGGRGSFTVYATHFEVGPGYYAFYDRHELVGSYPVNLTTVDLIEVMEDDEPETTEI